MEIIKNSDVENKVIELRNQKVLIDSDVAELYGVATRDVNKAVKNNRDKFPHNYIFELSPVEKLELVQNFHRFAKLKHSVVLPKGFTERGLYMLATIMRSPKATQTTLAIVDTFAKVRELNQAIITLQQLPENSAAQKSLLTRTGNLVADVLMPEEDNLTIHETETTLELGFPFMRLKKIVKKSKK